MSAVLTVEFRVPAKYAEVSREIIIETLKEKLMQLKREKEELMEKLNKLCRKYRCSEEELGEVLLKLDTPEADMDWVEVAALRDIIEDINHKIEVLRAIIEQNKA